MFNFEITPLGNFFFILSVVVFGSLFLVKNKERDVFLHLLLLSSLGCIFYANDLISLFIGWEVMSWSSYFLLTKNATKKTLQKYIIFNLAAGFSLLLAILIIYSFSGSFSYAMVDFRVVPSDLTLVISILVLLSIFIKSGIVPFHYWVVDSYTGADDILSTILSAIVSKVGIFAFILFFFGLIEKESLEPIIFELVAWIGVITSIVATFKAISQNELKRLLAYSSIAQLGYIITVLSIVSSSALEAGLYHTVIHTLVKLLLFANIATIIYVTQKTKFSTLGGLLYSYPLLFIFLVIGIIALAGMPPLGGFNSKFLIYTTLLEEKKAFLLVAVMISGAASFLYCYKLVYGIYLGQSTKGETDHYKQVPITFYIPQLLAVVSIVLLGIFPSLLLEWTQSLVVFLGLKPSVLESSFILTSAVGSFHGGVVMGVFGILFALILGIFLKTKSKAIMAKDNFDISFCGEIPTKDNTLHYGYGMGQELQRISFVKVILNNSSKYFWETFSIILNHSANIIKNIHTLSTQTTSLLMVLFFTILLFVGIQ